METYNSVKAVLICTNTGDKIKAKVGDYVLWEGTKKIIFTYMMHLN